MSVDPDADALTIARCVAAGEWSAVAVAEAALERARSAECLGAFAALSPERALADAAAVDAAVVAGRPVGALAGVPVPIKDLAEVAGLPFEGGSAVLRGNVGQATDVVAQRLMDAGSVTLGKTATPEFGFPCYTEPAGAPPAVTPWDITRGAGGSSGGAAAAVAAGVVAMAHASDGGGSVRIPAASCGVVGMKPSRGLVSTLPSRAPGPGLVSDGVITTTVADTALGLDVLSGRDARTLAQDLRREHAFRASDDTERALAADGAVDRSGDGLLASLRAPMRRLRIGVTTVPVISDAAQVHPVCVAAVDTVAGLLSDLGHELAEAPRAFPASEWANFDAVWTTGAASIPLPPQVDLTLTPMTRWLRERGREVTAVEYARALASIQMLTYDVEQRWADLDVVLTPTLAQPPAKLGALRDDADPAADFAAQIDYTPWTSVANLTGRPSISLPLIRAEIDGVELPIGVMLTARVGDDALVLRLAAQLEAASPWPRTRSVLDDPASQT